MLNFHTENNIFSLKNKARLIRNQMLDMIFSAKKGHIGGSLSCVDILTCLYYNGILNEQDKFILSKGHAVLSLYIILADLGIFDKKLLLNYQKDNGVLLSHPHRTVPGIVADTGSLGHGLGIAAGIALSAKLDDKDFKTFVLLGDGECHEGSVWEAALFAAQHKLDNLIAIIDKNDFCSTDSIKGCCNLNNLVDKFLAFNWNVMKINGNSIDEIRFAFESSKLNISKPLMIIAHTVKGKGISFMENSVDWHHRVPNEEEYRKAKKELQCL